MSPAHYSLHLDEHEKKEIKYGQTETKNVEA